VSACYYDEIRIKRIVIQPSLELVNRLVVEYYSPSPKVKLSEKIRLEFNLSGVRFHRKDGSLFWLISLNEKINKIFHSHFGILQVTRIDSLHQHFCVTIFV
jgi:hypothetical protein